MPHQRVSFGGAQDLTANPSLSVYPERVPIQSGRAEGLVMSNGKNFWCLYLLRCADGSIYTGISNDVDARVREHNQGKGAKYTAQRRPVFLIYQEQHPDQSSVRRRE